MLNTIARVGVIDEKLMGSNNWHLDMGFVCLHEHWVAQMGLAIDDQDYLDNYRKTLDYFRDNAISPMAMSKTDGHTGYGTRNQGHSKTVFTGASGVICWMPIQIM